MKILALEFSSPQRSVAVLQRPGDLPSQVLPSDSLCLHEVVETAGLNTRIMGMIDAALREASVEREQINTLAIGLGPGSYSGIRRAIAAAQGWQLCDARIKLLGISSVDCLVAQALGDGLMGRFNVVIDARRGEFYLAACEHAIDGTRKIEPLRLATFQELQQREANGERFIGPDIASRFSTGRLAFPRAATLARLALDRNDFLSGEKMEPIYLRPPQFVKTQPGTK